jgi:hypothetical protein
VQKIIGGNLLRVFRQVWKDPATVQKPTWSA